jgi:hypothetical protein
MEHVGGSLPKVLDYDGDYRLVSRNDFFDIDTCNSDVCPQLIPSRPLRAFDEVSRSNPQKDGRESQDHSKNYKDFIFSIADEITEAVPIGLGHNFEGGNIIFQGIVGGLFLVLLYAGLKRW